MRMAESIPQTVPCSPACPPVRNHHSYSANRLLIDKINTMQCKNSHQRHCRRHRTSSNNAQTDGQDRPETELVQVAHNQKTLEPTQSVVYFNDIYTAASLTQQQTHSHKQATHLQSFISHYLHTTNSKLLTTSKQWCVSVSLIVAAAVISTKVGSGCVLTQDISESCRRILMKFFEGWDEWLATDDQIVAMIRIMTLMWNSTAAG